MRSSVLLAYTAKNVISLLIHLRKLWVHAVIVA